MEDVKAYQRPECSPNFDSEHDWNVHFKYTHGPSQEEEPTADFTIVVLRIAGIQAPSEVATGKAIPMCPLTVHKPKSVSNINGKEPTKDQAGYRNVRILFDTVVEESLATPGGFFGGHN